MCYTREYIRRIKSTERSYLNIITETYLYMDNNQTVVIYRLSPQKNYNRTFSINNFQSCKLM